MALGAAVLLLSLLGFLTSKTPSAAAESSLALTCSVTRLTDSSFRYQLSQPPSPAWCDTCWEDDNKTVIARGSSFIPGLVTELTNRSVTLKTCRDFLLYTQSCSGVNTLEEAECRVNCSELQEPRHIIATTQICVFGSWCPEQTAFISVSVCVIVFIVVIVFWILYHFGLISTWTCRRHSGRISYSPATQQIKTELSDVV